jgi:ABC-2 type transport system permease protein/oleandomycin transport system permease protein
MTAIDAPSPTRPVVDEPSTSLRLRWALADTNAVLWRDTIRTLRQPEMLAFAVIMGSFFLVLFNYVFGGSIGAGADIDYLQFLVPGVLVITALNGAQQTSMGLAADLAEGVTDRFRSLPMSQVAVIAGRTFADAGRNVVGLTLVALLSLLMGYRFGSVAGAVGAVLLATGLGFAFSWMGAAIAAKVRQPDMVGMLSMFWLFPMMLASTAFAPAETMPGWLQPFARYQPVSVTSDAVRGLAGGTLETQDLLLSLLWMVGMLVVFVPLSVRLYTRADG